MNARTGYVCCALKEVGAPKTLRKQLIRYGQQSSIMSGAGCSLDQTSLSGYAMLLTLRLATCSGERGRENSS